MTEVSASKLGKEALEGTVSASAAKSRAGPEAIGATEYFRLFIWSTIFLKRETPNHLEFKALLGSLRVVRVNHISSIQRPKFWY